MNGDNIETTALVSWDAAPANWIGGYRITWNSNQESTETYSGLYEKTITGTASGLAEVKVYSIGEFSCDQSGDCTRSRWSEGQVCTTYLTSNEPTQAPSYSAPTASPTTSTPTNDPTTSDPTTSPTTAPSYEPSVSPSTSAPTDAPSTSIPSKSPSFSPTGLPTTAPSFKPSQMPQWQQTVAVVFLDDWTNQDYWWKDSQGRVHFNQTTKTSLEELSVSIRVYTTPEYHDTAVGWGLYEVTSNATDGSDIETQLQNGTHVFPSSATIVADVKRLTFTNIAVSPTQAQRLLRFRILPAEVQDQFGRDEYYVDNPAYGDILYTWEQALTVTESESEKLPWWIWPLIIGGSVLVIATAYYIVRKQIAKRKRAEKSQERAEEDLRLEQDGFFQGIDTVTENKLGDVMKQGNKKTKTSLADQVEMIHYDDDNEQFTMNAAEFSPVAYSQQQTNVRSSTNGGSRMPYRKSTEDFETQGGNQFE